MTWSQLLPALEVGHVLVLPFLPQPGRLPHPVRRALQRRKLARRQGGLSVRPPRRPCCCLCHVTGGAAFGLGLQRLHLSSEAELPPATAVPELSATTWVPTLVGTSARVESLSQRV